MATSFDEAELSRLYSALAEGGPEFSTAIVRSGEGGSIAHRAETREDFCSRYEINYGELDDERRRALRSFAILRKGRARGFRFLAPDDHDFTYEPVGYLDEGTGEVDVMSTTAGGITEFYAIRYYVDAENSYVRRIVKISPYADFRVAIYGADLENPEAVPTIPAIAEGAAIPETDDVGFTLSGSKTLTVNFTTGEFTITPALANGKTLRLLGEFHLPVAFMDDWHRASIDESAISSLKVGIEEILPIELGIT